MWFDYLVMWITDHLGLVFLLVIAFFVLRAMRSSALVLRAISCKTLWLDSYRVDANTLFDALKSKIESKGFSSINFSYANIADKYTSGSAHSYLKITYKGYSSLISAFPLGEKDGVISYWVVAPIDRWSQIIKWLPFFGQVIAKLMRTPTLYMADVQGATRLMIEDQIKEVIDELTKEASNKREASEEFKTYIQALTTKKK